MATDEQIEEYLAALALKQVPFEGEWNESPYPDRVIGDRTVAVLVDDPEVQQLVVDRDTGEVLFVEDGSTEPELVNQTLSQFAASAEAYFAGRERATGIDEEDEDALEENGEQTLAAIRALDPEAVRDENQFWAVAAEELGYGM
jgi:SUKH-4 immunity protein